MFDVIDTEDDAIDAEDDVIVDRAVVDTEDAVVVGGIVVVFVVGAIVVDVIVVDVIDVAEAEVDDIIVVVDIVVVAFGGLQPRLHRSPLQHRKHNANPRLFTSWSTSKTRLPNPCESPLSLSHSYDSKYGLI
jgi:hypothetical protein